MSDDNPTLIEISIEELKEHDSQLWKAMRAIVDNAQLCLETQIDADDETIAELCRIAMSYCGHCGNIDYGCQCWNDE